METGSNVRQGVGKTTRVKCSSLLDFLSALFLRQGTLGVNYYFCCNNLPAALECVVNLRLKIAFPLSLVKKERAHPFSLGRSRPFVSSLHACLAHFSGIDDDYCDDDERSARVVVARCEFSHFL